MLLKAIVVSSICALALSMYIAEPVHWHRHQYLVKVLTMNMTNKEISTCSGSLLSPSIVLTSAKCFAGDTKNTQAQAIIKSKDSKSTINKAMLAVRIDGDLALMKIDAVAEKTDSDFCDKDPYPSRVARLPFKSSITEAPYQNVEPKVLQDSRCRVIGFTTNDDVEDFATSNSVQMLELDVRADKENLMFSEVNVNSTGRACWDDIGAPLECMIDENKKWFQVGLVHAIFGREMDKDSNTTLDVSCSDVQTMQFVVFGDNTFAHAIEHVDKSSVFEAQAKCF